jgi:flagellar basal-body rod protein FlgB
MIGGMLVFALASARLAHASQRTAVIARNIANADTPGFKAQDVEAFDFDRTDAAMGATPPQATRPGHGGGQTPARRPEGEVRAVAVTAESPDRKTVTREEQMVQAAETPGQFELAATLYAKHLSMLRTAIGRDNR